MGRPDGAHRTQCVDFRRNDSEDRRQDRALRRDDRARRRVPPRRVEAERTTPRADATTTRQKSRTGQAAATSDDRRFAEFDADLLEEQTIRAEWAKAVSDGAIDVGSDSILKAIDEAERETQFGPAHPAQVALDHSLDDELLPKISRC